MDPKTFLSTVPRENGKFKVVWKLYLDDVRTPKASDWTIARNCEEAVQLILKRGMPVQISFDHDLGTEQSGLDLAKWLVEQVLDGQLSFPEGFRFNIHSANPEGAANIEGLMGGFLRELQNRSDTIDRKPR